MYPLISDIFSEYADASITPKHGSTFRFRINMSEALAKTDIEALELKIRSLNCLRRMGIHTIGDLCSQIHTSSDLQRIRNCGRTSIAEIMDKLFFYHFELIPAEKRIDYLRQVCEMNIS